MPSVKLRCPKCGREEKASFKVGEKPPVTECPDCHEPMGRDFGTIGVGENESDQMTRVKQMMKHSQSFSGRDKTVF